MDAIIWDDSGSDIFCRMCGGCGSTRELNTSDTDCMVVHRAVGMSSLAEAEDRSLLRDSKPATGCSWLARYCRQWKTSSASLN